MPTCWVEFCDPTPTPRRNPWGAKAPVQSPPKAGRRGTQTGGRPSSGQGLRAGGWGCGWRWGQWAGQGLPLTWAAAWGRTDRWGVSWRPASARHLVGLRRRGCTLFTFHSKGQAGAWARGLSGWRVQGPACQGLQPWIAREQGGRTKGICQKLLRPAREGWPWRSGGGVGGSVGFADHPHSGPQVAQEPSRPRLVESTAWCRLAQPGAGWRVLSQTGC